MCRTTSCGQAIRHGSSNSCNRVVNLIRIRNPLSTPLPHKSRRLRNRPKCMPTIPQCTRVMKYTLSQTGTKSMHNHGVCVRKREFNHPIDWHNRQNILLYLQKLWQVMSCSILPQLFTYSFGLRSGWCSRGDNI